MGILIYFILTKTRNTFKMYIVFQLWTLVGVYIGIALLGCLMASLFIDTLPVSWLPDDDRTGSVKDKVLGSLGATVLHLRHLNQILLIPLTIYSGLEQTFYSAEFYRVSDLL